jgi:hypothetical protein
MQPMHEIKLRRVTDFGNEKLYLFFLKWISQFCRTVVEGRN